MSIDDAAYVGEPYTHTFELFRAVQTLKHPEQLIGVFYIKPDAVIADKEDNLSLAVRALHLDHGSIARTRVFDGVSEKVARDESQHRGIAADLG